MRLSRVKSFIPAIFAACGPRADNGPSYGLGSTNQSKDASVGVKQQQ